MKIRAVIGAIFAFVCGWTFYAHGDCHVSQVAQLFGSITNSVDIPFNGTCAVNGNTGFPLLATVGNAYSYSEVDHVVSGQGTNAVVYDTFHLAGTAIETENLWVSGSDHADSLVSDASASATEDVVIQWNSAEAPPTSITFQGVYLVQGQVGSDFDDGGHFDAGFAVNENQSFVTFPAEGLYVPAIGLTFSANVLGGPITCPVNALTSIGVSFGASVQWNDPTAIITNTSPEASDWGYYASYTSPGSYTASCYFEGFTDFVDESNQPVDPSNLTIIYVNPKTNLGEPLPKYPVTPTFPSLQVLAVPGGPGLTLQWPLYASNYQLEMTTNVAGGLWTTNSLPAPVQVGLFLQVTVPATNSAAFFRLVQMN